MRYTFPFRSLFDVERRLLSFADAAKGSPESKPRTYEEVVAAEKSKRLERTTEMLRLIAAIDSDGRVMECFRRIMEDDAVKEQEIREFRSLIMGRMRESAAQLTQGKVDIEEVIRDRLQYFPVDYEDMYAIGVRENLLDRRAVEAVIRRANEGGGERWSERTEEAWRLAERLSVVCREINAGNPRREELMRERQELQRRLHEFPESVHEAIRTRRAEIVRSGGFDLRKAMKPETPPRAPDKSTVPEKKPEAKSGAAGRRFGLGDFLKKLLGVEPPEKTGPGVKPPEGKLPTGPGGKPPEKSPGAKLPEKAPPVKPEKVPPFPKKPDEGGWKVDWSDVVKGWMKTWSPGAKPPEGKLPTGPGGKPPEKSPGAKLPEKAPPVKPEKVPPFPKKPESGPGPGVKSPEKGEKSKEAKKPPEAKESLPDSVRRLNEVLEQLLNEMNSDAAQASPLLRAIRGMRFKEQEGKIVIEAGVGNGKPIRKIFRRLGYHQDRESGNFTRARGRDVVTHLGNGVYTFGLREAFGTERVEDVERILHRWMAYASDSERGVSAEGSPEQQEFDQRHGVDVQEGTFALSGERLPRLRQLQNRLSPEMRYTNVGRFLTGLTFGSVDGRRAFQISADAAPAFRQIYDALRGEGIAFGVLQKDANGNYLLSLPDDNGATLAVIERRLLWMQNVLLFKRPPKRWRGRTISGAQVGPDAGVPPPERGLGSGPAAVKPPEKTPPAKPEKVSLPPEKPGEGIVDWAKRFLGGKLDDTQKAIRSGWEATRKTSEDLSGRVQRMWEAAKKSVPEKKAPPPDKPKSGPGPSVKKTPEKVPPPPKKPESGPGPGVKKPPEKKSPAKPEKVPPPPLKPAQKSSPPDQKEKGPEGPAPELEIRIGGKSVRFDLGEMDFVGEVDDPEVRATIEDLNGAMPTLFDAIIIGDRVRLDQPVPLSYGKGKLDAAIRLLSEPRLQNVYVAGIRLLDIFLEVRGRLERGSKPPQ